MTFPSPRLIALALTIAVPHSAALAGTPKAPPPAAVEPADIQEYRDDMIVITDGKKHFVALNGKTMATESYFYGDGVNFHALRVFGGGGSGGEGAWTERGVVFWEPRVDAAWKAGVDFKDGAWSVQCRDKKTPLTRVADDAAKALVAKAKFWKPRWQRRAYALARDDKGRYYYVDRQREPEGNRNFRLFVGPQGNLKLMKMTNVVSDSEGDLFATRGGELRLVLNKGEYAWVQDKDRTRLIPVPVEDNHVMIYTDLGVYSGEALGTPCDDL